MQIELVLLVPFYEEKKSAKGSHNEERIHLQHGRVETHKTAVKELFVLNDACILQDLAGKVYLVVRFAEDALFLKQP